MRRWGVELSMRNIARAHDIPALVERTVVRDRVGAVAVAFAAFSALVIATSCTSSGGIPSGAPDLVQAMGVSWRDADDCEDVCSGRDDVVGVATMSGTSPAGDMVTADVIITGSTKRLRCGPTDGLEIYTSRDRWLDFGSQFSGGPVVGFSVYFDGAPRDGVAVAQAISGPGMCG